MCCHSIFDVCSFYCTQNCQRDNETLGDLCLSLPSTLLMLIVTKYYLSQITKSMPNVDKYLLLIFPCPDWAQSPPFKNMCSLPRVLLGLPL